MYFSYFFTFSYFSYIKLLHFSFSVLLFYGSKFNGLWVSANREINMMMMMIMMIIRLHLNTWCVGFTVAKTVACRFHAVA